MSTLIDGLRGAAKNDKLDSNGQKNVNNLSSVINDGRLSLGINRKPPPSVPQSESMRSITQSYALGVNKLLPKSWSMPSYLKPVDAVLKWWRVKNKATYVGLPPCPNALPDLNQNDKNKAEVQAQDKVDQAKGSQEYQRKLAETTLG